MTTRAVGSVFGGFAGNLIFSRMNTQLVIAACIFASGVSVILTPVLKQLIYLHVTNFVCGMTMSFTEIGAHVWIQVLWKEKSGPILQLYNLIFGVGGIIAPLICEPFLSPHVLKRAPDLEGFLDPESITEASLLPESKSRVSVAYAIMGTVFLANVVSILLSYCVDKTNPVPEKSPDSAAVELPKKMRYMIVFLTTTYISFGVVSEVGLANYIPTFVLRTEGLDFTKSSAAYLSSVFWSSYTLSRVVTTGLSFVVDVSKLIMGFQSILLFASIFMAVFIKNSTLVAWVGSAFLGFGIAPCFGNGTVWAVKYITLTHNCMCIIMVSICIGATLPALVIGPFIDTKPMSLMYGQVGVVIVLSLCAVLMLIYERNPRLREHHRKRRAGDSDTGEAKTLNTIENAQG
ncbi:sodium-dependent glucose transporter 1-like [Galendromus occidentalis]|uniref:Sodium-dependent glucose transporter 1-like n=1 Tax=Galendromus occidentalis TaxID=34638 RepID=A0AAJ6VVV8_9ACAR|nr:sodium-dependent glucose transporter 1-like [Galendromus occidentalis]